MPTQTVQSTNKHHLPILVVEVAETALVSFDGTEAATTFALETTSFEFFFCRFSLPNTAGGGAEGLVAPLSALAGTLPVPSPPPNQDLNHTRNLRFFYRLK